MTQNKLNTENIHTKADHFSVVVSQDFWRQLWTVHAMRCKLICQSIFRTVGDRQEGRDLNEKTLAADSGRQQPSAN